MSEKTYQYIIQSIQPLTDKLIQVFIVPENDQLIYQAGQYVTIQLSSGEQAFFSIANAPLGSHVIELHIRHTTQNGYTNRLLDEIKTIGQLTLLGPYGHCIYQPLQRPTLFLAGGTGFAPIKAIIEQALFENTTQDMYLYWGAKTLTDLYMYELPQTWDNHMPNFHFTAVLSEASVNLDWQGATGLAHQAILDNFLDLTNHQVYASGPNEMIIAALENFQKIGLHKSRIFSDAFEFINV